MSSSASKPIASRRATKACYRCRKRKIRCDFQYPTCGACARSGSECQGFDSQQGIERPRSTISHLENHVARLEIELTELRSNQRNDTFEVQGAVVERLTRRLAEAHAQPGYLRPTTREDLSLLSLTSPTFLSQSPLPPINDSSYTPPERIEGPLKNTNIAYIPRQVIDIMLKNYCDIYRPQYPCLEESELYASRDRIFDNMEPSHFDFFSVAMTLAISANTLISHDERRAISAAEEFWGTAMKHLQFIGRDNPWQRLQALQLLAHYGLLNPKLVNCCNCAAAATRLCIQLGLHEELPVYEQRTPDTFELNIRRRLFWTSYNIDAALHTIMCLPFAWPRSAITINYPEFGTEKSPTAHVWAIRRIEAEVTTYLYYPTIDDDCDVSHESFNEWYLGVSRSLEAWYEGFKSHQKTGLASKIEFYEIMYQAQIFRMNKSSPRFPKPTLDMRRKAIRATIALIREYASMHRLGKLFYIWHGAHYLVEFGASLLELVLSGLEILGMGENHLDGLNVTMLTRAIKTIPQLLWKISNRWPDVQYHAAMIEEIAVPVLVSLSAWEKGHHINVSDSDPITRETRRRLKGLLLFSDTSGAEKHSGNTGTMPEATDLDMLVTESQEVMIQSQSEIEHLARMNDAAPHTTLVGVPDVSPVCPPPLFNEAPSMVSLDANWAPHAQFPQLYDQSYLYTDPGTMGSTGGEEFFWDMAGMNSDDIFAALLEGRDVFPS